MTPFTFILIFYTCMMIARYEMIHDPDMYHNIRRYLRVDYEIDKFSRWAFTDMYEKLNSFQCMIAWNELHGDKFKLESHNLIKDTLPKMIEIWRDENDRELI